MKTLLLARHAKSSWDNTEITDHQRPLNKRGQEDAPRMAQYLKQCGYLIHQIISSDALRALQTAETYKQLLIPEQDLITHQDLYLASNETINSLVSRLPDHSSAIMLLGHNPGMTHALNYYTNANVDNMPTCSVAIIQFDIEEWKEIESGSGDLLVYEYPKKIQIN